jgi:hypothetical protein
MNSLAGTPEVSAAVHASFVAFSDMKVAKVL